MFFSLKQYSYSLTVSICFAHLTNDELMRLYSVEMPLYSWKNLANFYTGLFKMTKIWVTFTLCLTLKKRLYRPITVSAAWQTDKQSMHCQSLVTFLANDIHKTKTLAYILSIKKSNSNENVAFFLWNSRRIETISSRALDPLLFFLST